MTGLKSVDIPLDGEHYQNWIAAQLRAGTPEEEIIEELRPYNRFKYPAEQLQRHLKTVKEHLQSY